MTILRWDDVSLRGASLAPGPGRILAVFPGTVNADECFRKAGFEEWNCRSDGSEFDRILAGVVAHLGRLGEPRLPSTLAAGRLAVRPPILWLLDMLVRRLHRPRPPLHMLQAAANDDRDPPCVVTFGDPACAAVRTSSGHDILWAWLSPQHDDPTALLAAAANGAVLVRTPLAWECLGPD